MRDGAPLIGARAQESLRTFDRPSLIRAVGRRAASVAEGARGWIAARCRGRIARGRPSWALAGALRRPWRPLAKTTATRMVGATPPARPARPAEVRELDAAGLAVARRCEARAEGQRRGGGHRLGVSAHASLHRRKPPRIRETRPCAHSRWARSGRDRVPVWATPPPVDAPLVELHERHSTDVLPTSNAAPPAASGTT